MVMQYMYECIAILIEGLILRKEILEIEKVYIGRHGKFKKVVAVLCIHEVQECSSETCNEAYYEHSFGIMYTEPELLLWAILIVTITTCLLQGSTFKCDDL